MQIDAAKHGGELAAKITAINEKVAAINTAIAEGWVISNVRALSPDGSNELQMIVATLDAATSAQTMTFALQIYQAQLTDLNAQLAAL